MDATQKPKILYIEDDQGLAIIYSARFKAEGFDVRHCADGESALQTGRELKPDLIILDLMMPAMSGFDVLDLLRNTPETASAKIVVMSALSQPEDIEKTRALGADDFIIKSQVTIDDVIARIRALLGEDTSDATLDDLGLTTPSGPAN